MKRTLILFFLFLSISSYAQHDTTKIKLTHIIKFNSGKLFTNQLAFSYECRFKNKGAEIELGYIYPTGQDNDIVTEAAKIFTTFPALFYSGVAANIFLNGISSIGFIMESPQFINTCILTINGFRWTVLTRENII
ncbi:MAG: hypothetical protein WCQ95_07780 [Bacteroidota bacterium]